ncbi:hypothetical protein Tco_0371588 [Tanacetum coccineum]
MELNELIKLRDGAYENTRIYKERTKKWHDSRLREDKNFKVGDKVLLFNSRFKMHLGKLKSKWYGPNVVKVVYPYGMVEITDKNRISFKVNGQRLKKYYDGNIVTDKRGRQIRRKYDIEAGEKVSQYGVFQFMDTAYWSPVQFDLAAKKLTKLVNYRSSGILVIHRTNVSRPQLRSTQMKDKVVPNNSQVKFKKTKVEDHHRISSISNKTKFVTTCNDSLNSRTSNVNAVCATCGKCVFNSNHDACVSKFLNDVNARTMKANIVPISTRKPKRQANKSVTPPPKKAVASNSTI